MIAEKDGYNQFTQEYIEMVESDSDVLSRKLLLPELLRMAEPVADFHVLDAGCGEGRVSRMLFDRGARVVGIDIAENFITAANQRAEGRNIAFYCCDLCQDIPDYLHNVFDLIVSNLVIDDLPDFQGYIKNISQMAGPNARVVVAKNNPYSAVSRGKVSGYFDSGASALYQGMATAGVNVNYYHRTLAEHVNEFSTHGFFLSRMSDLEPPEELIEDKNPAVRNRFRRYLNIPFLMILEFVRTQN